MVSIGILGCGNVGSRHLRALLKVKETVNIHVFDPSVESLERALARASEVECSNETIHRYSETHSLPEQPSISSL